MATLLVGPGQAYTTINAAYDAAVNGDTLSLDGGTASQITYNISQLQPAHGGWAKNLTVTSTGNFRAKIEGSSGGGMNSPLGCWNGVGEPNTGRLTLTFENLEVEFASSGVRFLCDGDYTLRNCYIHDCDHGVQGGHYFNYNSLEPGINNYTWTIDANITLERCILAYCGTGSGQTHNLYVTTRGIFTFDSSYTHHVWGGHLLKSRAQTTRILYSRVADEDCIAPGSIAHPAGDLLGASAVIDIPNYGDALILGSVVQKGWYTNNGKVIGYGEDGQNPQHTQYPVFKLSIAYSTLVGTVGFSGPRWVVAGPATPQSIEFNFENNLMLSRAWSGSPLGAADAGPYFAQETGVAPAINRGNVAFADGSAPVADASTNRDYRPIATTGLAALTPTSAAWTPTHEFALVGGLPTKVVRSDTSLVGAHALVTPAPPTATPPPQYTPAAPNTKRVDWTNPINQDTNCLYAFDEGAGSTIRDLAYGSTLRLDAGCQWVNAGPTGKAVQVSGGFNSIVGETTYALKVHGEVSIFQVIRVDADGYADEFANLANDEFFKVMPVLSPTYFLAGWASSWNFITTSEPSFTLGAFKTMCFVVDSANMKLYIDNVLVATSPKVKSHNGGGPHQIWPVKLSLMTSGPFRMWNRALSDAERASLHADPLVGTVDLGTPPPPPPPTPTPTISTISPTNRDEGLGAFTLTVTGTGYDATSVVKWNASTRTTTYVNATTLSAAILSTDVVAAGTANVQVSTPGAPADSNAVVFTINAVAPPPPPPPPVGSYDRIHVEAISPDELRVVFCLTVPEALRPLYAKRQGPRRSERFDIPAAEYDLLRNGTRTEEVAIMPLSGSLVGLQTALEAEWTTRQNALNALAPPPLTTTTKWDGTTWS